MLTSHLGLDIPPDCHITVGDKTRYWKDGQVTMFDTSIFHDAVNDSDEYRYILMLRVWHPELTDTERAALQFLFDGDRVGENQTPEEVCGHEPQQHRVSHLVLCYVMQLEMEDGDSIDAMVKQVGGSL